MGACQALQFRMRFEPDFQIHHPGLKRIFTRAKEITPILDTDRYTVPEYQELLKFITSGELYDMLLSEMPEEYFKTQDIPEHYHRGINTNPN